MPSLSMQAKPEIQRPVSNIFILSSVLVALFLNGLPWEGMGLILRPDFVALVMLVLVYTQTDARWNRNIVGSGDTRRCG